MKTCYALLIAIGLLTTVVYAEKKVDLKPQTKCPVMGGKIDKSVYTDHEGERIYMCCAGCDKAFKKNPEKYVKKMKDAGIAADKVPEKKK